MDEESPLLSSAQPTQQLQDLQSLIDELWLPDPRREIFQEIGIKLRAVEGAVVSKYEEMPKEKKKELVLGDMKELMEASAELSSNFLWLYRFPALLLTVAIASSCIPLSASLDHVIAEYPILSGFPPAISAAAGCIGIQNTAIIIRALGVKLIKGNPAITFVRYMTISFLLSIGAAILETIVAWIVVSAFESTHTDSPWSFKILYTDVPVVIFLAMTVTGTLAGIMGAGIPLLVNWISHKTGKSLDPAHWVGPIETVAQELSATVLTFYIAEQLFTLLP